MRADCSGIALSAFSYTGVRATPIREPPASADHAAIQAGGGMYKVEFESCGRSMRWYEWFAGLLLFGLALGVRAESGYKCVDSHGAVTYQAIGCAAQESQRVIAIAPPPRYAASPHYVVDHQRDAPIARSMHVAPRDRGSRETAFECRVGDGR